jgi:hypothetical protein
MNYGPHIRLDSFEDIRRVIILLEREGVAGQTYLLRCLHAGRIAYLPVPPDTSSSKFKAWVRLTAHEPAVACIGDDDGFDRGPGGWKITGRVVQWARSILLHRAGAELWHYEHLVRAAEVSGRALIVECSSSTLPLWIDLMKLTNRNAAVLLLRPPPGGTHPVSVDRSKLQ